MEIKSTDWLVNNISGEHLKYENYAANFGAALYTYRVEHRLTIKEFSKMLGIPVRIINKWESLKYNFSLKTLAKIFDKLDLNFKFEITWID